MRLAGKTMEEVRDWVEETKGRVAQWFTVDDLNHLKRGGRISAAQAFVGGMLGVKPILRMNDTGHLETADKVRGRQAALQRLLKQLETTGVNFSEETIYVTHSDCAEEAEQFAAQIRERFKPKEVVVNFLNPVVGSHTGLGLISALFLGTGRD